MFFSRWRRFMTEHLTLQARSTEVRQLMNELLAIELHRRQEMARQERFRDLVFAESRRFEEDCPGKAEELAEMARLIADQPYPGSLAARADRILALSYTLQGNVRRLSGDPNGAEERFQKAALALTCPPNAVERAFYCQSLAWLREEQGQVGEARSLLWRAVSLFGAAGTWRPGCTMPCGLTMAGRRRSSRSSSSIPAGLGSRCLRRRPRKTKSRLIRALTPVRRQLPGPMARSSRSNRSIA
jgi:hypothetical protein